MSHGRTHQESVEEAVFKYVGVDLQGGKHGDENDNASENIHQHHHGNDNGNESPVSQRQRQGRSHRQHQQEQAHSYQDDHDLEDTASETKKYQNQRLEQLLARDSHSQRARMPGTAVETSDGTSVPGAGVSGASAAAADVEWFLRHELGPESTASTELDVRGSREPQSVAAAAVAAAFGSSPQDNNNHLDNNNNNNSNNNNNNSKRPRVSESGRVNAVNPSLGRHSHNKRSKISIGPQVNARTNQASKLPHHLGAVDPELASLDDPEDVTEHEQLVRKAILDADSIAHHPDFQHYLNTEDDSDEKSRLSSALQHKSSASGLGNIHDHGRKIEVLPKVTSSDTGMRSHSGSGNGSGSGSGSRSGSGPLTGSGSVVGHGSMLAGSMNPMSRMGSGSGAGAGSDDQDISHLIQDAATKASNFISPQSQSTGKSFDAAEEQALEHFIGEYQAIKNLSRRQICERIWSNERRKDDFWTNICKVLPYRTRSSIYKHVRRKYHIFEQRGKWTLEEEQELAALCLEKEGQWSEIGKILGRMPEDCRDRWRNYVKCGNNRASNKWSLQEEEQLKTVISELLDSAELPDDQIYDTADDSQLEGKDKKNAKKKKDSNTKDAINWTVVSERMGGARSRIQCRYKWNKLLKKQAMSKIKNISEEDKTWILEKLRDMGFTEDSQVDWDELAILMPGRQWSGTELKLCYEKLRTGVRYHKDRTINQICKELIGNRDGGFSMESGNLSGATKR